MLNRSGDSAGVGLEEDWSSRKDGPEPSLGEVTSPEPLRVLLVNQHVMLLEGLMAAIKQAPGIRAVGASVDFSDALYLAKRTQPEVIVLGIDPAARPGASTAAQLRAEIPGAAVIILAASSDEALLLQALDSGCSALLTTGRTITDLMDAIRAAAKGDLLFPLKMLQSVVNRAEASSGSQLTNREQEILQLLASGEGTASICRILSLSSHTVRNHIRNLLAKLCVHSRLEAVLAAQRRGLVTGEEVSLCR